MVTPGSDEFVAIGRIRKAHGVQGDLLVQSLTDFGDRFEHTESVFLELPDTSTITATITGAKRHGKDVIVHFADITDRNAAEVLAGSYIMVKREDLMELDDNSFYSFDIVGMLVVARNGEEVGTVVDVERYPANDLLVIETRDGFMRVPAIGHYLAGVDREQKKLVMDLPEGLPVEPKE